MTTRLLGELTDQAALVGILNSIYELQRPLLSVEMLPSDEGGSSQIEAGGGG